MYRHKLKLTMKNQTFSLLMIIRQLFLNPHALPLSKKSLEAIFLQHMLHVETNDPPEINFTERVEPRDRATIFYAYENDPISSEELISELAKQGTYYDSGTFFDEIDRNLMDPNKRAVQISILYLDEKRSSIKFDRINFNEDDEDPLNLFVLRLHATINQNLADILDLTSFEKDVLEAYVQLILDEQYPSLDGIARKMLEKDVGNLPSKDGQEVEIVAGEKRTISRTIGDLKKKGCLCLSQNHAKGGSS